MIKGFPRNYLCSCIYFNLLTIVWSTSTYFFALLLICFQYRNYYDILWYLCILLSLLSFITLIHLLIPFNTKTSQKSKKFKIFKINHLTLYLLDLLLPSWTSNILLVLPSFKNAQSLTKWLTNSREALGFHSGLERASRRLRKWEWDA